MDMGLATLASSGVEGLGSLIGGMVGASNTAASNAQQFAYNQISQQQAQNFTAAQNQGAINNSNEQATINREFLQQGAQDAYAESSYEADKARNWLYNMSGSNYQRTMYDMKAAGLNPILAYGGISPSPSSAPSGQGYNYAGGAQGQGYAGSSSGLSTNVKPIGDLGVSAAGQAAGEAVVRYANVKKTEADTEQSKSQTKKLEEDAILARELQNRAREEATTTAKQRELYEKQMEHYNSGIRANDASAAAGYASAARDYADTAIKNVDVVTAKARAQIEAQRAWREGQAGTGFFGEAAGAVGSAGKASIELLDRGVRGIVETARGGVAPVINAYDARLSAPKPNVFDWYGEGPAAQRRIWEQRSKSGLNYGVPR